MNQNRRNAFTLIGNISILALAALFSVVGCSSKPDLLPPMTKGPGELQYYPPGPPLKQAKQFPAMETLEYRQQTNENSVESANQVDSPDTARQVLLTGRVADENTETTADGRDSSSEAEASKDDSDGPDKLNWTPKPVRRIDRNLGID